jgi:hypothetical protein
VLDAGRNPTYADRAGGRDLADSGRRWRIRRPPGEWQSYDIVFERRAAGEQLVKPAFATVFMNGVLMQAPRR